MAFCTNCGQEVADGVKFCSNCGQPITAAAGGSEKRKTVYDGEVHKCPNCGEVLDSFVTTCPSCGYELRGAKANTSVKEFAINLTHADNDAQKISLIRSFPIPHTKEDVLEFMVLSATNFDAGQSLSKEGTKKDISDAWLTKIEQSYHKAKLLFSGDKDFAKIQKVYDQVCGQIAASRQTVRNNKIAAILLRTIGLWGGLIIFIIAFMIDIFSKANTSFFHLGACLIMIIGAFMVGRKSNGFAEAGVGIVCSLLSLLLGTLLQTVFHGNGSLMELAGGVSLIIVIIRLVISSTKKQER